MASDSNLSANIPDSRGSFNGQKRRGDCEESG